MPLDPLLLLSGTELARRIRSREVTARQVIDAHIAHIERVNPNLNALVAERFAHARAEASEADARIAARNGAPLPPFLGVPCTIKESFALKGMPNSSGLVARRHLRAGADAITVRRLKEAGAIPLGVTNTSELCMWMESNNRVYGRSNNPYNPAHIVGGSSGGEGAIVGAGGSPFGLGADIGGSIRMPAFFNGVFGHKPSGGLVPGSGQYPIAANEALRYLTTGPICRRAEDLMPLLRILAGPDGEDSGCTPMPLGDPGAVGMSGLQVTVIEDNGRVAVSADIKDALRRAAGHLKSLGAAVRTGVQVRALKRSLEIWSAKLSAAGGPTFAELLSPGQRFRPGREFLRWAFRRSPHTLPSITLTVLEKQAKTREHDARRFIALGEQLHAELAAMLAGNGVILYPPFPTPAPKHYRPLWPPFQWVYTAIVNVLEFPSTQVPMGLNAHGLPVGTQVIAGHGRDHVSIAVAQELERAFGGWVPPPGGGAPQPKRTA